MDLTRLAWLFVIIVGGCVKAPGDLRVQIAQGIEQATRCQQFMHEDATEYRSCVDALADRERGESPEQLARRLGVYYFGWVGALNSERLSLPGAANTANEYLVRYRRLQRTLNIDDPLLCPLIPGDCAARSASANQRERQKAGVDEPS